MAPRIVLRAAAAAAAALTLMGAAATVTTKAEAASSTYTPTSLVQRPTILEALKGQPKGFSSLVEAINVAGLAELFDNPTSSLTVFAPNNAAFSLLAKALGRTDGEKASVVQFILGKLKALNEGTYRGPLLATILRYHVATSAFKAKQLKAAGGYTSSAGPRVRFSADGKRLVDAVPALTDPQLLRTDKELRNGIVHVISRVMLPPGLKVRAPAKASLPASRPKANRGVSIAKLAQDNTFLSIFVIALQRADMVPLVDDPAVSLTVLAPTDAAFAALAQDLGKDENNKEDVITFILQAFTRQGKRDPIRTLSSILQYHILRTPKVLLDVNILGKGKKTTIQGGKFEVTTDGEVIDLAPELDNAKVVKTNLMASNGVIHLVDRVLMPSSLCSASAAEDCVSNEDDYDYAQCRCIVRLV